MSPMCVLWDDVSFGIRAKEEKISRGFKAWSLVTAIIGLMHILAAVCSAFTGIGLALTLIHSILAGITPIAIIVCFAIFVLAPACVLVWVFSKGKINLFKYALALIGIKI